MAHADPRPGGARLHIGAEVGYYTAIIAHMVGSAGRVTAMEIRSRPRLHLAANFAGQI